MKVPAKVVSVTAVAAAVLGLSVVPAGATSPITVAPRADYATGDHPETVVAVDLNGDGVSDLVSADRFDQALSIFPGIGGGAFGPRVQRRLGLEPTGLATADFDGDGKTDVAVSASGFMLVLRNSGDGTLGGPGGASTSPGAEGIAAGDLNGDGLQDAVVSRPTGLTVVLGRASGEFGSFFAPVDIESGGYSRGVVLRDFTGDGVLDIAIGGFFSGNVSVLTGRGDGTFEPPVAYPTGANPIDIAAGDFTGDGRADLATADYGAGTVSVLPGQPGGTFGAPIAQPIGPNPFGVAAADLDGDGDLDLAVSASGADSVAILGNGDGTFDPATTLGTGATPTEVYAADLDKDARPDLVTTNRAANGLSVLLNRTVPPVPPASDLAVALTATPRFGLLVPALQYTVTVHNNGPDALQQATITATLPRFTSGVAGPNCTASGTTVTCSVGALATGASATRTFSIPLGLLSIGSYQVTVKRTASTPADPSATNDSAGRTCSVLSVIAANCR